MSTLGRRTKSRTQSIKIWNEEVKGSGDVKRGFPYMFKQVYRIGP